MSGVVVAHSPTPRSGFGSHAGVASSEGQTCGEAFYPRGERADQGLEWEKGVLNENATPFYTPDEPQIDEIKEILDSLSREDVDILCLRGRGHSPDQIAWLLNVSLHRVRRSVAKAEQVFSGDMLLQAGLITLLRQSTLENRYARHLARSLRSLTDGRIMRVVVDDGRCGLQLMLATGQQVKMWLCADDGLDKPGWAFLETLDHKIVCEDEMLWLADQVASLVGRGRNPTESVKQILHDIAERAVDLINEIDGDCELENNGDEWEADTFEDQDEVPPTQNLLHQAERQIEPDSPCRSSMEHSLDQLPKLFELSQVRVDMQAARVQQTAVPHERAETLPPSPTSIGYVVVDSCPPVGQCDSKVNDINARLRQGIEHKQEIEEKRARLRRIGEEIASMPEHGKGFARVFHRREIEELSQWLQTRDVGAPKAGHKHECQVGIEPDLVEPFA